MEAQDEEAPSSSLAEQLLELDVRDPARLANLPVSLERLVEQQPTWNGPLNRFRVHAAWKLCQWERLDEALEQVSEEILGCAILLQKIERASHYCSTEVSSYLAFCWKSVEKKCKLLILCF